MGQRPLAFFSLRLKLPEKINIFWFGSFIYISYFCFSISPIFHFFHYYFSTQMKKISTFLIATAAFCTLAVAQSQRVVLVEEFTQASCGPCASQNPALNATLAANPTKVVSVKYQTDWPGYDPMNEHNPAEVDTRVSYYGVTGVPNVRMDGTAATGAPSVITQAAIDTRYAVGAPCTIALTHSLSSDLSKINVSANITATADIPAGATLHVVVIEKAINFATAPGSNGEKDFYSVMKKMLPDAAGTTLPAISNGMSQPYSFSWDLKNIYDMNQLAVVAFIQESNKNVLQAVMSAPQALPNGTALATIASLSAPSGAPTCNVSVAPSVTLKNVSSTPITSCDIEYMVGSTTNTYNWTGTLLPGSVSAAINLPAVNGTVGVNTIEAKCLNINGLGIGGGALVAPSTSVGILPSSSTISTIVEDFQATGTPAGYFPYDVQADGRTWFKGSTSSGVRAMACDFFSGGNSAGNIDYLYIPSLNLTGKAAAAIAFDVASAPYSLPAEPDKLEVVVSTDCGATWTSIFSKQGATLNTVTSAVTSPFIPTSSQWRPEVVDLTPYVNNANVLVAFKGTSGYGNYCWVDNINVTSSGVGIAEEELSKGVKVYPNPSNGVFNIESVSNDDLTVRVVNTMGQEVVPAVKVSNTVYKMDLSNQASGTYMIMIDNGSTTVSKVVTLNK